MDDYLLFSVREVYNRDKMQRIDTALYSIPGVEYARFNARDGVIEITGADMDRWQIMDTLAGFGCIVLE